MVHPGKTIAFTGCAFLCALAALMVSCQGASQWETIAPGIEFRLFRIGTPNTIHVVRADRQQDGWVLDTMLGQGKIEAGPETLSAMVRRYQGTANHNLEAYNIIAAINGDYFSSETNQVAGGQIIAGNLINRFAETAGPANLGWKRDGSLFISRSQPASFSRQFIRLKDNIAIPIAGINTGRGSDQLILYTHHFGPKTHTNNFGVELLVRAKYPLTPGKIIEGEILEKQGNRGGMALPFGCIVLSAHGKPAQALQATKPGETLTLELPIAAAESPLTQKNAAPNWDGAYSAISGDFWFVQNGTLSAEERMQNANATARHPRTAVAFNRRYLYLIVVDGRSMGSVGMSMAELAQFCIEKLRAEEALALDGGGSSTLLVGDAIKNRPSAGSERPIRNGLFIARMVPAKISKTYQTGQVVQAINQATLRLGPSRNYSPALEMPKGRSATILEHPWNGIRQQETYWWLCRFGDREGWCPEELLHPDPTQ